MIKALVTAFTFLCLAVPASAQTPQEVSAYKRAITAASNGNWTAALAAAKGAGPIATDVIEWQRLRAGRGRFSETVAFLERRADWPGLKLLRRRSEHAVPKGRRTDDVLAFFAAEPPQTGAGVRALAAAHRARGVDAAAEAEIVDAWLTKPLGAADETALLSVYAKALENQHAPRLDMLLWRGNRDGAERMYPLVSDGMRALSQARLALREQAAGVDTLIEAVPEELAEDPGLAFERMQWRARKGRRDEAIALMLSRAPSELGEPQRWAGWRRSFARSEMRAGRAEAAYKLASQHGLTGGSAFADLEWLSGYLALTYLGNPERALEHFLRFRGAVETPISLGRAGYWEGRAYEALGDTENANLAYAFGAEYQTSFYGLLAAQAANLPMDPRLTGQGPTKDWRSASFSQSSVFQAAQLMIAVGQRNLAEQFLRHLTESLGSDEIRSLGAFLSAQGEPHLAVMIGKQAARQGIVVPSTYYPVVDLGIGALPIAEELALAIARRESEFDPVVKSGVGARGLMQLMPRTARDVARYLQIPYSLNRLTSDPAYNARLGSAYLDEMLELFNGNVVMTAAAYNAGPGRPIRWMNQRGDPRRRQVDIIDWIEHIPFDETRNYVMRVTESLPVYRARLSGQTETLTFLEELIAMPGHQRSAVKGNFVRPKARPELRPEPIDADPPLPQGPTFDYSIRPEARANRV